MASPLTATAINCSLSSKGRKSSTDAMIAVLAEHFAEQDVSVGDPIRIAAHTGRWGVRSDEGEGEDGAHHVCSQLFQSLNDVGWTIPAVAGCYWVGEAMGSVDFKDLVHRPRKVTETAKMVATNAAHLARLLKHSPYPG